MGVDRSGDVRAAFPSRKAALHRTSRVHGNRENALKRPAWASATQCNLRFASLLDLLGLRTTLQLLRTILQLSLPILQLSRTILQLFRTILQLSSANSEDSAAV